ncbi:Small GTP-binding protein domain [Trinorchestia longiramus]|nr:Small GTP-binding protein domain [Trinorchestia longiramus]
MRSAVWVPNAPFLHGIVLAYRGIVVRRHASLLCTTASSAIHHRHLPSTTDFPQISRSFHGWHHEFLSHVRALLPCYRDVIVPHKSLFSSVLGRCTLDKEDILPARRCRNVGHGWSSVRFSSNNRKKRPPVKMNVKSKMEIVRLWPGITVTELAAALGKDIDTMLEIMMFVKGSQAFRHPRAVITDNAVLSQAARITGKRVVFVNKQEISPFKKANKKDAFRRPPAEPSQLVPRPPVITIMGHVDHGKTTLLDALRKSNIVDSEFGGITQHIGAFQFSLPSGSTITVLDTPGHAAFSSMRGRGANVTDIVVLVVAADDGVMPQTKESIEHCKRANVPMVVALNKIDKPDADVNLAQMSLLQAGVQLEKQGGDVQCVEISAKKGTNLTALVEAILALAEILEVSADPKGLVEASVIEAKQLPVKGKVATCLVQRGTLRRGALLVAGTTSCRVRVMYDEHEKVLEEAPPATPVQVTGWDELPSAGDDVLEVASRMRQKEVIAWRQQERKEEKLIRDKVIVEAKAQEHRQKHRAYMEEKRNQGIRTYCTPLMECGFHLTSLCSLVTSIITSSPAGCCAPLKCSSENL